jgi:hypothetical protein
MYKTIIIVIIVLFLFLYLLHKKSGVREKFTSKLKPHLDRIMKKQNVNLSL